MQNINISNLETSINNILASNPLTSLFSEARSVAQGLLLTAAAPFAEMKFTSSPTKKQNRYVRNVPFTIDLPFRLEWSAPGSVDINLEYTSNSGIIKNNYSATTKENTSPEAKTENFTMQIKALKYGTVKGNIVADRSNIPTVIPSDLRRVATRSFSLEIVQPKIRFVPMRPTKHSRTKTRPTKHSRIKTRSEYDEGLEIF